MRVNKHVSNFYICPCNRLITSVITLLLSALLIMVPGGKIFALPFNPAVNYDVGNYPRSVAVGDFNGDNKFDLAVANSGNDNVSVLLGNGDGTFNTAVNYDVEDLPYSVAVGDFNGDNKQDLAVANCGSDSVSILLGNGGGTFTIKGSYDATNPAFVAIGDFNGDNKQDLATSNNDKNYISILLGNGDGSFNTAVQYIVGDEPISIAVDDFNGDNKQDLAVVMTDEPYVAVLLGNGDGTFQDAVNYGAGSSNSVTVGDFNSDNKQDLALANYVSKAASILLGNGDGTFDAAVNYGVGDTPWSVATGDFNSDNIQDLAVANMRDNNVSVLTGNGNGTFQDAVNFGVGTDPFSVAVGDFNGDNYPDLAVVNYHDDNISVLINTPVINSVTPDNGEQGQTIAVIITGTGLTDVVAINFGAGIMVNGFTVDFDTQITASITIAAGASIGTRNVSVTTPGGTSTLNNGFTVNQPAQEGADKFTLLNTDSSSSAPEQIITGPPRISVKNVQPQQTQADQPVIIYASIANGGEQSGSYTAELKINGQVEEIKTGRVGSHSAVPLEFEVSRSEPGTYEVDINGQQSYFTVSGEQSSVDSSRMIFIIGLIACAIGVVVATVLLYRRRSV